MADGGSIITVRVCCSGVHGMEGGASSTEPPLVQGSVAIPATHLGACAGEFSTVARELHESESEAALAEQLACMNCVLVGDAARGSVPTSTLLNRTERAAAATTFASGAGARCSPTTAVPGAARDIRGVRSGGGHEAGALFAAVLSSKRHGAHGATGWLILLLGGAMAEEELNTETGAVVVATWTECNSASASGTHAGAAGPASPRRSRSNSLDIAMAAPRGTCAVVVFCSETPGSTR
eukprot:CAMPEP_0115322456 /NCGR_PEP_ID=MMETSP0270-20121206/81414_1 /TAXON_ID=71861 /ORGANISM="Scrippsiella trochoidea, Strain CCMP3099" /LENGTH=237 /DNA_ID=CAMNT_0002742427 /DNA_START=59 /DNA_END=772 /DNA_ORIENTATION=-